MPVSGAFSLRVTFSKHTTGFALGDLEIEGGSATSTVSAPGERHHDVTIRLQASARQVTVRVSGGAAEDLAGRRSLASETFRIEAVPQGFRASFENVPNTHDGASEFTVQLRFSEAPELG